MKLLETHSYKEVEAMTGISKSTLIREMKKQK
ncbi:putative DNA-binding transcriptional regulator AlpA [Ornithinibacillus bavariensis]